MRTVGPVGITNPKTYGAESGLTRGYAAQKGVKDGNVTAVTGAGQRAFGIVAETVSSGEAATVVRFGDALAIAGGTVAYGDYVKVDATGKLVTIAGTAGEEIVGRAESAAAASGNEFIVFVLPSVR